MDSGAWGATVTEVTRVRMTEVTYHAWMGPEFSKNLVKRGSNVPLLVEVLIITSDSLGALPWFRGRNTGYRKGCLEKPTTVTLKRALSGLPSPLHSSSSLLYTRIKVGVFQTLETVNKC